MAGIVSALEVPGHSCLLLWSAEFWILDLPVRLVGKARHPHVVGLESVRQMMGSIFVKIAAMMSTEASVNSTSLRVRAFLTVMTSG